MVKKAKANIKKKGAYPLCGNKLIAFDKIEIFKSQKKNLFKNYNKFN